MRPEVEVADGGGGAPGERVAAPAHAPVQSAAADRGPESGDSLSGNERNHLFLSREGRQFEDVAMLSGLDHPADGRAVAALDYDRDGWLDFAVVNANSPLFQLFRNEIAALPGAGAADNAMLALRFVGANRSARPSAERSNRDGIGVVFEVEAEGERLVREHRAGDGFAAQSSATRLVGLGGAAQAEGLVVRWPSGVEQSRERVPAFSLVTVYEDASESPDGSGFAIEPHRRAAVRAPVARDASGPLLSLGATSHDAAAPPLKLFTTMATWCEVCRGELPQIAKLRASFGEDELALVGVPVDEGDDAEKVAAYRDAHAPAYRMLDPLSAAQRAEVSALVESALMVDALPAAIVTDARGGVLQVLGRVPSVSEPRRLQKAEPSRADPVGANPARANPAGGESTRVERQARYVLQVGVQAPAGSGSRGQLRVRAEPRKGWHFATDAPTSLALDAPSAVALAPALQRGDDAHEFGERALEFRAGFHNATKSAVDAVGKLKFGICADGNSVCIIERRDLELVLEAERPVVGGADEEAM